MKDISPDFIATLICFTSGRRYNQPDRIYFLSINLCKHHCVFVCKKLYIISFIAHILLFVFILKYGGPIFSSCPVFTFICVIHFPIEFYTHMWHFSLIRHKCELLSVSVCACGWVEWNVCFVIKLSMRHHSHLVDCFMFRIHLWKEIVIRDRWFWNGNTMATH